MFLPGARGEQPLFFQSWALRIQQPGRAIFFSLQRQRRPWVSFTGPVFQAGERASSLFCARLASLLLLFSRRHRGACNDFRCHGSFFFCAAGVGRRRRAFSNQALMRATPFPFPPSMVLGLATPWQKLIPFRAQSISFNVSVAHHLSFPS